MFVNCLHNEKELLGNLSSGDKDAFQKLYDFYSPRIYGNLIKMVRSAALRQELLQEIFVTLWDNRKNIDPEKSFRSYLFRIAENKVYDFFRKVARDRRLYAHILSRSDLQYSHIEETLLSKEDAGILQKAIDALPPQRKQIFTLCRLDGKSYFDVSRQLCISTSTISDHIVKANHSIRNYLYANFQISKILFVLAAWQTIV